MSFVPRLPMRNWTPEAVQNHKDPAWAFAEYCAQTAGIPWPNDGDLGKLKIEVRKFFYRYPQCDWYTMCRIVRWMTARKIRVPRLWMVVDFHREAWSKGGLPELDPGYEKPDPVVDQMIQCAIKIETDEQWLDRLMLAQSPTAKQKVYSAWESLSPSVNV